MKKKKAKNKESNERFAKARRQMLRKLENIKRSLKRGGSKKRNG